MYAIRHCKNENKYVVLKISIQFSFIVNIKVYQVSKEHFFFLKKLLHSYWT